MEITKYVLSNYESLVTAVIYLITAFFVGATALFTGMIAKTTSKSFVESNRPEIIAYLEPGKLHREILFFSIENVGNAPAQNIKAIIGINEEDLSKYKIRIKKQVPNNSLIKILPPKSKRITWFASALEGCIDMRPFNVVVEYENLKGNRYKENFILDVCEFREWVPMPLAENDIAKSLREIEKHIKNRNL